MTIRFEFMFARFVFGCKSKLYTVTVSTLFPAFNRTFIFCLLLQNKQRRDRERRQQQQQANNMQVLSKTQKSRERLVSFTRLNKNLREK